MSIFENIEEIFQDWRSYNEYAKSLVTLTTAFGTIVIFYYSLKLVYKSTLGLRLYLFSQICNRTDLVKKYGKWAVISGSTDGIGLAMAKELAKRGHSILVMGRNDEKIARTKEMLLQVENVGQVDTVNIDLSDSSVENFNKIRAQIDPDNRDIGILINNAGFFRSVFRRFNNNDVDELVNIVNVNILAAVHLTRMIMPGMLERRRGLVVNVSSIMGNQTIPFTNLYSDTKVFMNSFTESLQIEYSNHPVDIVCLTPGPVYTKLFTDMDTLKSTSLIVPSAEDYARSSINCLSTGINKFSGTSAHGLMSIQTKVTSSLGLFPFAFYMAKLLYPHTIQTSPVMKRKNNKAPTDANAQPNEQENVFNATIET